MKEKNLEIRTTLHSQDAVIDFSPWIDQETGIEGWIAIFGSTSMPAAGGGLRIGAHLTEQDAIPIAKAMRTKFQLTGPGNLKTGEVINGAGIILQADPKDVTPDLLIRFLMENKFREKHIGTAASTGIDTHGVCEQLGLVHLQEPIARALSALNHTSIESTRQRLLLTTSQLQHPLSERHQRPTDVATGFAAAEITHGFVDGLQNKKIGIVGFGAVGGSFAKRASELGGRITFIANHEGAIVLNEKAQSLDELFSSIIRLSSEPIARLHLDGVALTQQQLSDVLQSIPFDVLVLAGPEKSMTDELTKVIPLTTTIVPLANKPFASKIGEQTAQDRCTVLPSTSNVGNAVLFSLALMNHQVETPENLLAATIDLSRQISRGPVLDNQQPVWKNFVKGESHE